MYQTRFDGDEGGFIREVPFIPIYPFDIIYIPAFFSGDSPDAVVSEGRSVSIISYGRTAPENEPGEAYSWTIYLAF
jgi:hypothetical protein